MRGSASDALVVPLSVSCGVYSAAGRPSPTRPARVRGRRRDLMPELLAALEASYRSTAAAVTWTVAVMGTWCG
jgi:hypothetical protein